jgi:Tfp pilus tip-associated adhesin PilY1
MKETPFNAASGNKTTILIFAGIFCFWIMMVPPRILSATCVMDISDEPMETKVTAAPANIMFVLDNSGSMDWEFMTTEYDGLYSGKYYIYPDSAYINGNDRAYGSGNDLGFRRNEWLSQWVGYNKIFYDPDALYSPWPGMTDADVSEPFSNPNNNGSTDSKFDMGGEFFTVLAANAVEVVVDNSDSGFLLNIPGQWGTATHSSGYGADYYYTLSNNQGAGNWAKWTPSLPAAGNYRVAVWWTSNSSRDSTTYYTIYHNGLSETAGPYNMQTNGGQWNDLGEFYFSGDGTEYVRLDPDMSGLSSYSADAVRFYIPAQEIRINNAHYFRVDDVNDNGVRDPGEQVYLVNFVDRNNDGVLDGRDYYLFDDTNDNGKVEDEELTLVSESSVPARVRAGLYDEDGTFVRYATDGEDLQNFANWFSYYRKRELTGKAAVAGAIVNIERVQVGFYSINSGLRQTVLPIKVKSSDIIIDNRDSGYTETGSWGESGASGGYKDSSRYTNNSGHYATWTPDLPETGTYKVYVWYTYWSTRDTNAKYIVHHAGGDSVYRLNQRVDYSQWVELGEFSFSQGSSGYVRIVRDGSSTGSSTSADAVKFELTSGSGVTVDETDTLLGLLYSMDSSGGTPLRHALNNVGRYFDADDGHDGGLGPAPWASEEDGGTCQQAFAIVITDGFWNGSSPGVGNQDADSASIFDGPPYADAYSDTLADVAMKYYKNDLSSALSDQVPTDSCDRASHQHMVTYGVSFGVIGTLDPNDYHPCLLDGSSPPWPSPTAGDPQKIDDLWHATVNGRGLFFSASNPQELVSSLTDAMSSIESKISSGASVSVNGDELHSDTVLYQASYESDSWTGDVTAFPIDPQTGEIKRQASDILWQASEELQTIAWDDRNIFTFDPDSETGIVFAYDDLTADQKTKLNDNPDSVDYIKGKEISGFRSRTRKLGDIVHSAPLLLGGTIYAGGNDGMLHAFDSETGQERFAYIPNLVMDQFYNASDPDKSFFNPGYEHRFFVDLTPAVRRDVTIDGDGTDNTFSLLVGGLGKGGKGYYCLDITDADDVTISSSALGLLDMVKWEYPSKAAPDNDMGYSYSMPVIARSNAPSSDNSLKSKWVVIFGNGYESSNGNAVLHILNTDGALLKKIDTGVGGCNGLSSPAVVDVDSDLKADYVYAGDLKGNLWKFDIRDEDPVNWDVAYKTTAGDPAPLFQAPGKSITSKPDVMRHCRFGVVQPGLTCPGNDHISGYMVFFGTGQYLGEDDRTNIDSQYVFGIWDFGDDEDNSEYPGTFDSVSAQLSNMDPAIQLLEQTQIYEGYHDGHYLRVLSDNEPSWTIKCDGTAGQNADLEPDPACACPDPEDEDACLDPASCEDPILPANAGWFFKLPIDGERIIKDVIVRDKKLIYITFTPDSSPCSGGGSSIIHEVDACSGGRLSLAQFDITGDRAVTADDLIDTGLVDIDGNPLPPLPPSGIGRPGLLHIPVFVRLPDKPEEMKIFSSSAGTTETIFETAEKLGMFYWRNH